MSNVLAIAQKELRSYFASPIAYIVIGMLALLYGCSSMRAILQFFVRQSMQMGQFGGQQPVNINEQMIRLLFQNVTILVLFLMPVITMRTYSEEKRSGTIELLLTSPVTDCADHPRQVPRRAGAVRRDAGGDADSIGVLFIYGNPEWKPIATTYLGLLLFGGCFISVGLLISSLTKNQIVALARGKLGVFLLLWIIDWMGSFAGPTVEQPADSYLSVIGPSRGLSRRGSSTRRTVIYYVSFIGFGLFPDREVCRHANGGEDSA